jgi:Asp-tRNA(Asn)/Glu-tRNA(Gln) amidotransferase B subunit
LQYGVTPYESAVIVEQPGLSSLFEQVASPQNGSFVAKWYGTSATTSAISICPYSNMVPYVLAGSKLHRNNDAYLYLRIITEYLGQLNAREIELPDSPASATQLAGLLELLEREDISGISCSTPARGAVICGACAILPF